MDRVELRFRDVLTSNWCSSLAVVTCRPTTIHFLLIVQTHHASTSGLLGDIGKYMRTSRFSTSIATF